MAKENQEKFQCPECESKNIRFRFKVNKKDKNNAYANVSEEIQCANCFMDIGSKLFPMLKISLFPFANAYENAFAISET